MGGPGNKLQYAMILIMWTARTSPENFPAEIFRVLLAWLGLALKLFKRHHLSKASGFDSQVSDIPNKCVMRHRYIYMLYLREYILVDMNIYDTCKHK